MEDEKFGTVMYDGRIYNLDNMSDEELEKLELKMLQEEEKIRNNIDKLLENSND